VTLAGSLSVRTLDEIGPGKSIDFRNNITIEKPANSLPLSAFDQSSQSLEQLQT